jgi:hypothetical protein
MYRLGHMQDDVEVEHVYPATFRMPAPGEGRPRIVAGVPSSDPDVLLRLAACLEPPLVLLYVLHTPRGEAAPGRYQSPDLDFQDVEAFIADFRDFLSADARFDLWVHSPAQGATIAWDRHNLIYAYGPLDHYAATLVAMGYEPGDPAMPTPHVHNYHAALDPLARRLIGRFHWQYSELRPEDGQ